MRLNNIQLKRAVSVILFFVLLSAVGMTKALAQYFTVGKLNYSVNSDGVSVTVTGHVDGTAATGELVIPETVTHNGSTYSVTSIRRYAFNGYTGLTGNLVIPNSVTSIGYSAFSGCTGFTGDLVIPNSVTAIGSGAFYGCTGFNGNLVIPNSVTSIEEWTFSNCTGFTGNLVIPNSVTTIGAEAFYVCFGFTGNLTIGSSVTTIGNRAFDECTGFIGNLIIPNSVTTIGDMAFYGCIGFTGNLTIGSSVTSIGQWAFAHCTNFSSVEYNATNCADATDFLPFQNCGGTLTIGENVDRIPAGIFSSAAFTGSLFIPKSVTTIGNVGFSDCTGFTGNLVISNSVTAIGEYAFKDCTGFSSVEYDATNCADVSEWARSPFNNCGGTLTIGENVERIPANMFRSAAFIGSLFIPNSVTAIGNSAFYECTEFTGNLTIGSSVTTIDSEAFYNCNGFTGDLVIPNSVTTIGSYAFCDCIGFTGNLTIGSSVTSIGGGAFCDCIGFTGNLVIPNSVTIIEEWAFSWCYGFTGNLIIGSSVTSIGSEAFHWSYGFSQILSHAEMPPTVGTNAFYGIHHNIPVYVPCGSLSDYQNARGWDEFNNIFECFDVKEITAAVTPSNSGTVTGAGTYEMGTICTLTAIANEGYTFIYWTENSVVVSTEAEYSFTVTGDRNLVANFVNGSLCSLTIEMYDSYGDGWNGNKLTISNDLGGYNEITLYSGSSGSTTLPVPDGSHITLGWIMGNYTSECSFNVRYANGDLIYHGEDMSSDFSFEFDMDCPATMFTISATANPIEGGTVIGAGTYEMGTICTLTAIDNEGYTFFHWTEDETVVSTDATYEFVVTADRDFIANFTINTYNVTVAANPVEGGTVAGGGTYNHGATATLTATANTGYTFTNWTKNYTVVSTEQTYSFTVTEDASYVANFELNSYTITATANPIEGGTIIGAGTYTHGATVTLTANANTGYTFINWTKDGTVVSTNPTYSFTVTEDASYVANFELNSYTITATANPAEGGTIIGTGTYNHGATATLMAAANTGYAFIKWTKDGTVVSTNQTYSFTVTEDVDLVANFKLPGDANGDGIVDALDIVIIVNHIFGLHTEEFVFDNADVNGDGVVDALDIVIIVNIIFSKNS